MEFVGCLIVVFMICFVLFMLCCCFFFFKQKTAYEMRISDWSSDVCSSDLKWLCRQPFVRARVPARAAHSGRHRESPEVHSGSPRTRQIGRASCRERVCQYV